MTRVRRKGSGQESHYGGDALCEALHQAFPLTMAPSCFPTTVHMRGSDPSIVLCPYWPSNPTDKGPDPLFLFTYNATGPDSGALMSSPMPDS